MAASLPSHLGLVRVKQYRANQRFGSRASTRLMSNERLIALPYLRQ